MAIVTVKNKYQVVIPKTVRKQLGINRSDVLEAKVERGKLTYTRKALIDQVIPAGKAETDRFYKRLRAEAPAWLKDIWVASKRVWLDKLTMREINAEISAVRRSKKQITPPDESGRVRHRYQVSALLVPAGTQASVLLLALRGDIALYVSSPVLAEYEDGLRRLRFKLQPHRIDTALQAIRKVWHLVEPVNTIAISTHEADNRFLECAERPPRTIS